MIRPPRGILREHRFETELKKIESDVVRADSLIEGPEWVLARDPSKGVHVLEDVWVFYSRDIPKRRELAIFYAFNSNFVWLLSVVATELE